MTGIPLLIVFCLAIILMIVAISKFHIHPFLSLMGTSLVLAVVVGLPLEKIPGIIGSGFSGVFSSIGIVIILGALIGLILEKTGAAIRLADVVIRFVGEKHPQLALMLMGWIVSIPVFCDSGFVILNPIRKALCRKLKGASPAGMAVALSAGLYAAHVFIPPTPGPIAAAGSLGLADHLAGRLRSNNLAGRNGLCRQCRRHRPRFRPGHLSGNHLFVLHDFPFDIADRKNGKGSDEDRQLGSA